ncbi:nitroreductase family protein [Chitinibacter sp. GC72]|uniref:nitroreductase family protein n=1 Tax=Chitinibacter sp. GC72 TaxID=1526917 RepID=UPI0012FB6A0E|nr:nitroreductase family protein [Chitinibacter sp. GC72]
MQNWQFIAVRSQPHKLRLQQLSFGQQKVADAAVTFIVCGVRNGYQALASVLAGSVQQGAMPAALADSWVAMASATQHEQPQAQRDEAIRSASLAAMTLMLAAEGMGLGSCPMTGFDHDALIEAFALGDELIPVMLVTVGRPLASNWAQKPRKPLQQVLTVV